MCERPEQNGLAIFTLFDPRAELEEQVSSLRPLLLDNFVVIAAALLQPKINTRGWSLKNDAKVQFLFHVGKNIISHKKAQKVQTIRG